MANNNTHERIGIVRDMLTPEIWLQVGRLYSRTMLRNEYSIQADTLHVHGVEGLFDDGYRFGSPVTMHSKFRAHQERVAENNGLQIVHFDLDLNADESDIRFFDGMAAKHNGLKKNADNQLPLASELQGVLRGAIAEYLQWEGIATPIFSCRYER